MAKLAILLSLVAQLWAATDNRTDYTTQIKNQPLLDIRGYNFAAQTPGGSLAIGNNTITMTPVPRGVNGTDTAHYLYVQAGTGTAEACKINGGSGTSLQSSGSIVINCANTHSGAWTIGSATFGVQEAVQDAQTAGGGVVWIPAGSYTLLATITVSANNIWIEGDGSTGGTGSGTGGVVITRTGDFGDSIFVGASAGATELFNERVEGLSITHTLSYAVGPPPTIANRPTSGAHVHLLNCWECKVQDNRLQGLVYGVEADTVGRTFIQYNTFASVWDYANSGVQVGIAGVYLHHSVSGAGFPTYTYVKHNHVINSGYVSAARNITVNGNTIASQQEPVGSKYGVWIASCEVCEISDNSMEFNDYAGIHIASLASHSVSDAFLDTLIEGNFIDSNRLYGIDFDMTANTANYTLNFRVIGNRISGASANLTTLNGIYFAPSPTPGTFVRTAASTLIEGNHIFDVISSGIQMFSGGRTNIVGNDISSYNFFNSFPTNSLSCTATACTGDRKGNSAVYIGEFVANCTVTGNSVGGSFIGTAYDGSTVFTVNGVAVGYSSTDGLSGCNIYGNTNVGVQAPTSRSPAVPYDAAFLPFEPMVTNLNANTTSVTGCGTLSSTSTPYSGTVTSGTSGTCAPVIAFSTASSPTGWSCSMQNITHPGATNAMYQSGSGIASVSFTGTTVSSDVLAYQCQPY